MREQPIRALFSTPDGCFAEMIQKALGPGYEVRPTEQHDFDFSRAEYEWCDLVLLDLHDHEESLGIERILGLMGEIKKLDGTTPIIAIVGDHPGNFARTVVENGAYDTVSIPPDISGLRQLLRRACRTRRVEKELAERRFRNMGAGRFGEMLGTSEVMHQVYETARKVASCDVSVLISGETGTGKELLARALHRLSSHGAGPFVAFSCANLPETLVDDELFGHEKGAFTGAVAMRRGRFEAARGGTLLLDEIGDLPLALQAKFLRVLQERTFERLGSTSPLACDTRVVCATHHNLESMVAEGRFRTDLYYRLNVVQIRIPPLRERRDEIPVLAQHFLQKFAQRFKKVVKSISALALSALEEYDWPGNVRELENAVQHAVVMAEGQTIEAGHLPNILRGEMVKQATPSGSYEDAVREFKRRLVLKTLRECGGRKAEAARSLGITRGYLHRLINQLQLQLDDTPEFVEAEKTASEEPGRIHGCPNQL